MTFGEVLKSQREAVGMTQTQLADAVGLKQSDISRWERDERIPRWEMIQRIADALGVSTEALRTIEPPTSDDPETTPTP